MRRQTGDQTQEIEVTMEMAVAGGTAYRSWLGDPKEQRKLNSIANLVSRVYLAMEEERRLSQ